MRKITSAILICLLTIASFTVISAAAQPARYVTYEQFGAVGDGMTCDFEAIIAAHRFANANNRPVRANQSAIYYIGQGGRTAEIQTNTYWGQAQFIIDNSILEHGMQNNQVFRVTSMVAPIELANVETLAIGQTTIDVSLAQPAIVFVEDTTTRRFFRRGINQDTGRPTRDLFLVDQNGNIDPTTPILWDFDNITSIWAHPIDETTLTITGGHFTTIENEVFWNNYIYRGLQVSRSNVVVDGILHELTNETDDRNSPNAGFMIVQDAANVTIQNSTFSGRKQGIHGSYDIQFTNTINLTFYHVAQANCIFDRTRGGITGSNNNKNLVFDNVTLSRIDSHTAAHNLTIRNSYIGSQGGIPIIGSGTFLLENTTVTADNLISLRNDFGSTWDGDFIIRDVTFRPTGTYVVMINLRNDGMHDFGYDTFLPRSIYINGLTIDDAHLSWRRHFPHFYTGPHLFAANHMYGNDALRFTLLWDWIQTRNAPHPMTLSEEITIRNLEITSGRRLRLSRNVFRYRQRIFPTVNVTTS